MSVTDFECAIAKSQIGRYVSGENLAPEIARQLESHINNCSRCKELLQEKKNSLEAMIVGNDESIRIESDSIPMLTGSSGSKPDYLEVLADSARKSLREKLAASGRINPETVQTPIVANAFAYKNSPDPETIPLQIEPEEEPRKKKKFGLSALALYRDVPDESNRPAVSVENIRAAKAVIRDNDPSMKKPMMYLAGLCVVVAAMSFVLRDPTTLFGGRAESFVKTKPSNKVVVPTKNQRGTVAKVLPHKATTITDKGIDAHAFTSKSPKIAKSTPKTRKEPIPTKANGVAKSSKVSKAQSSLTTEKQTAKSAPKTSSRSNHKNPQAKPQAQRFIDSPKKANRSTSGPNRKPRKQVSEENVVKLYIPDTTPQSQEQK